MTTEEKMADLQLESVAEANLRARVRERRRRRRIRAEAKAKASERERLCMLGEVQSRLSELDPNNVTAPDCNNGTSLVPIAEETAEDDDYSTPTLSGDPTPSPPLVESDSDCSPIGPIRYRSTSEAGPDEIDSDNMHSKIEQVIKLGPPAPPDTDVKDVAERVRSIRRKYHISWEAAAGVFFFRLIKPAVKLHYSSEDEFKEYIENMLINWKDTLKYFLSDRCVEVEALYKLQAVCLRARKSFPVFPTILNCLYKHKILSQRTIVYWAQDGAWEYGPNETFLEQSSEFIKTLKQGLCDSDNPIELYASEEECEVHGSDHEDYTSEDGMDISD